MKIIVNFTLLASLISIYGCNEKISASLQSSSDSTTLPPAVVPTEYYFNITNSSDTLLNYKLHKTGSGNASSACEVKKSTALSSAIYTSGDADSDISCYFDAEELSLWHNGFTVNVAASANTCEYVGYSPYSYYNRIPGDSSAVYSSVKCGAEDMGIAQLDDTLTDVAVPKHSGASYTGCDEMVLISADGYSFNAATRASFVVEKDEDLCYFNYQDGDEEKCDIGTIIINERTYTYDSTSNKTTSKASTKKIKCAGKAYNCVKGPIRTHKTNTSYYTETTQATYNSSFSKDYTYSALEGTALNFEYANFRRHLANKEIDFGDSSDLTLASYQDAFRFPFTAIGYSDFQPSILDRYSVNLLVDSDTDIIDANTQKTASMEMSGIYTTKWHKPLAADPFMGVDATSGVNGAYRVNPFYTFYCFDRAMDVKARIRMVVRDWDRVFSDDTAKESISDIFLLANGQNSSMDIPSTQEIPGDYNPWNWYNDYRDWDDMVPMTRQPSGSFNAGSTIWYPYPTATYTSGFFNPTYFPNVMKEE